MPPALRKPTVIPSHMPDSFYVHESPANVAAAARVRDGLWDTAREISAVRRQIVPAVPTPEGLDWLEPRNVSGVHLYEEDGAWHADITLDGIPQGYPACIGASVPLASHAAARVYALSLLCDIVLAHSRRPRLPAAAWPLPPRPHAFAYDGVVVNLPRETVECLLACGVQAMDVAYARKRLEQVRSDLMYGERLSVGRMRSLDETERRAFLTVCALAALKGLQEWG